MTIDKNALYFKQVAKVIGEEAAELELQKAWDARDCRLACFQEEQGILQAFPWGLSPQGQDFWCDISCGKVPKGYDEGDNDTTINKESRCFLQVARVLGEDLAEKELTKVAEECPHSLHKALTLDQSFTWEDSPQGWSFWVAINNGDWPEALRSFPREPSVKAKPEVGALFRIISGGVWQGRGLTVLGYCVDEEGSDILTFQDGSGMVGAILYRPEWVEVYESPEVKQHLEILEDWKAQSLETAHDTLSSRLTVEQMIDFIMDCGYAPVELSDEH